VLLLVLLVVLVLVLVLVLLLVPTSSSETLSETLLMSPINMFTIPRRRSFPGTMSAGVSSPLATRQSRLPAHSSADAREIAR